MNTEQPNTDDLLPVEATIETTTESPASEFAPETPNNATPSPTEKTPKRRGCWTWGFVALWSTTKFLFRHWKFTLAAVIVLFLAFVLWSIKKNMEEGQPLMAISHPVAIEETAEEIRAMREIKEWEFLAIETEELVENSERGTFGNKQLVQIFRGTLRLGINMEKAADDWFSGGNGTAVVRLPDICLLDSAFIDETRTTTFHQSGNWNAGDKQKLYNRAQKAMMERALSPNNVREARKTAEAQFRKLFNALGYDEVVINFEGVKEKTNTTN